MLPSRPPPSVLVAASVASAIALSDVVDTVIQVVRSEAGAIFGTLLRDALLIAAAALTLRRVAWAAYALLVLLALALLRLTVADEWHEVAFNGSAVVGIVALLLPATRRWLAKPAPVG